MAQVEFSVNGKICKVSSNMVRETLLSTYLRREMALPGTKLMCRQGACGACVVAVSAVRYPSRVVETFAVNSCMVLVYSCHGWEITTIEGLGNRHKGYHEIQKRIAAFLGTQCGHCTPGFVMAIHSLLNKYPNMSMAQLEKSFASNICRCTGYRPILDTAKSFAMDATPQLCEMVQDIENLKICNKTKSICARKCSIKSIDSDWSVVNELDLKAKVYEFESDKVFVRAHTEDQIFDMFKQFGVQSYMLVDGNTAKGIEETFEYPEVIIDISDVESLKQYYFDQNFVLGANVSLEDCIGIFKDTAASSNNEFSYLDEFSKHFELIAHIPVRNIGSVAGNLMTKHKIPYFQSDVYILFSAVGAILTIRSTNTQQALITMSDFLKLDMKGVLILNILLPPLSRSHKFCNYKIMPRNQNALATVNSAFRIKFDERTNAVEDLSVVYGNISPQFFHAEQTEAFLKGKYVFNNETLQAVIKILNNEVLPENRPPKPPPECQRKLAIGLFYKFILSISPSGLPSPRLISGGNTLTRSISHGTQNYQTDPSLYPINQSLPKYEGLIQSSGEARYSNDIPPIPNEVFGAFVQSTVHVGEIDKIDTIGVLDISGVVAVLTAKDIPGKNSFLVPTLSPSLIKEDEEILAAKYIKYYGQPIALVVAETEQLAKSVATKVCVTYKNVNEIPPVLTIDEAKKDSKRLVPYKGKIEPKGKGDNVKKVINGVYEIEGQYHYYLEPITTVVVPVDQILEVYDSTQWVEMTQAAIAQCLGMNESDIIVKVHRLGGAFGGKLTRNIQTSTACAIIAKKLDRPCRFILPMQTNMTISGKRLPSQCEYEVGVDDNGKIQYLSASIIEDKGCSINDGTLDKTIRGFKNCYNYDYFDLETATVFTDLPCTTYMRAPGHCEGIASIEHIMEHIAFTVNRDIDDVRKVNMRSEDNDIPELIKQLKQDVDYEKRARAIEQFNKANRWMKKAIQTSVMAFDLFYAGVSTALVSIYRIDGTVTVTTGGIEMGQGLNTKARQTCAFELGIPIDMVTITSNYTFTAPNNRDTSQSVTSEAICYAIVKACSILKEKLAPVKQKLPEAPWKDVVKQAASEGIGLSVSYSISDDDLKPYYTYGAAILEVQLDVLTGRFQILRVDILEDVGLSMNPIIDIGQVEGAINGYFTSEKLVYDKKSGKLLTNRALNYLVPSGLDIPVDFRVNLRQNSRNPVGVLGSKAVGEMGVCTAYGITHALRKCIYELRKDSGYDTSQWINIDIPYTITSILKALDVKLEEMKLIEEL